VGSGALPAVYYEQYGELLTTAKKFEPAIDVYLKMEEAFKADQTVVANAVWGLGNAYLQAGIYDRALGELDRLILEFPWHPRAAEAEFGKGLVLEMQKKFPDAIQVYDRVATDPRLKGLPRARAVLGLGRCFMQLGKYEEALGKFQGAALLYEAYPEVACEALWLGGQCAEKLATSATEAQAKQKLIQTAIQQYRDLLLKYPNCKHAEEAKKRLNELAPGK
jgi:tetratricopeptide (TPR) repeat protein